MLDEPKKLIPVSSLKDGKYIDSKGREVGPSLVSDADKLKDQTVQKVFQYGWDLVAQIARFHGHSNDDVFATLELLAEQYNMKLGGAKGNVTLTSYDGLRQVEIAMQDRIVFGPELVLARDLVGKFIEVRSGNIPEDIMALLNHAFEVDKKGTVNRSALYSLRRLNIDHPIWKDAMQALSDSMIVEGTKQYLRIRFRPARGEAWRSLSINIASAAEFMGAMRGYELEAVDDAE